MWLREISSFLRYFYSRKITIFTSMKILKFFVLITGFIKKRADVAGMKTGTMKMPSHLLGKVILGY